MKRVALFLCLVIGWYSASAQETDSITIKQGDYSVYSPGKDMTYLGLPIAALGFLVKGQKKNFRTIRNNFQPKFHHEYDNYTQYLPLALTYGLKLAGVEGRSSWSRLLVSNAFSAATMAALVNSMKYTTKEMRPDGTSANSFPSGHTATAFMCATILHKEYGLTRSPWYSVAGYSIATLTGAMRMLNNRHWISDVLVGAGIGVMSVDLGYLFADLIYKDKGLVRGERESLNINLKKNPSFIGLTVGAGFLQNTIQVPEIGAYGEKITDIRLGTATTAGIEGAYFFNPYVGLGGRVRVLTVPTKIYGQALIDDTNENYVFGDRQRSSDMISENLSMFNLDLGVYGAIPLGKRFNIGSKFLLGRSFMAKYHVNQEIPIPVVEGDPFTVKFNIMDVKGKNTFKLGTGVYFTYAYKQNMNFKLFADYDYAKMRYDLYTYDLEEDNDTSTFLGSSNKHFGMLTIGTSLNLSF